VRRHIRVFAGTRSAAGSKEENHENCAFAALDERDTCAPD